MNIQDEIKKAAEVLKQGGIILYPTDTVWGIGCDATNEAAVQRIYDIKQRIDTKSMLVILDNSVKLQTYVADVPEIAWDLIDLTDKPLTIIYDGAKNLATNIVAADGSIGIRITKEQFSSELCKFFRKPIVSTSANISDEKTPSIFCEISKEIKNQMDYIVEYRRADNKKTEPSSIVKLGKNGTITVIRK